MEKSPLMLKDKKKIDLAEAVRLAKKLNGGNDFDLLTEEDGRMPSYVLTDGTHTVAVTKAGGYYSYMISARNVEKQTLTANEAMSRARTFLSGIGISGIDDSYYEIRNHVCRIDTGKGLVVRVFEQ